MSPIRILFVCTYLGGRSRIAEAFANHYGKGLIDAHCSGFEEGTLGQGLVKLMAEKQIEIHLDALKTIFKRTRDKEKFDYVVTLCHAQTTEQCDVFLNCVAGMYSRKSKVIGWDIPAFNAIKATNPEERWQSMQEIRNAIENEVLQLIETLNTQSNLPS
ncbi:MAG: hypothetical protein P8J27_09360 [Mariniblastus sp.]|nr:hypothetical protein [Mariniblastus sp.]